MVVFGFGVEKADNDTGFTFIKTDYTNAKLAPWLKQDGFVRYSQKEGLVSCKEDDEGAVRILVPDDQSGLRRLYRFRSYWLNAGNDDLLESDDAARVQVLYDPQGRAENLEGRVRELQGERERLKQEIDLRFPNALEYLKTGKFQ